MLFYFKIVCKTSNTEDTINAQIVLYNNTEIDANKDDIKFFLSVTGLKITFLNLFVSSILVSIFVIHMLWIS